MSSPPTVLYARLTGLLVLAVRQTRTLAPIIPVAVAEGKVLRDVCSLAERGGVRVGEPTSRARRLCPALFVVPYEAIDARVIAPLTNRFLDVLANHTPVIEPDGHDAAYADFSNSPLPKRVFLLQS